MRWVSSLVLVVLMVGLSGCAAVRVPGSGRLDESQPIIMVGQPVNFYSSLVGSRVLDVDGAELGEVQDVIVDTTDGSLAFVILRFEDPAWRGKAAMAAAPAEFVPLPWRVLTPLPEQGTLRLAAEISRVASAPQLERPGDRISQALGAKIERYWLAD